MIDLLSACIGEQITQVEQVELSARTYGEVRKLSCCFKTFSLIVLVDFHIVIVVVTVSIDVHHCFFSLSYRRV